MDVDTDEVVGLQIEDYVIRAGREHSSLVELLDVADLLGMTVDDVRRERHRILGYRGRCKLWLRRMIERVTRRGESRKQHLIEGLLSEGPLGPTLKDALAPA
ncbi:MAG: hypothetical protein M3464_12825 [Chloroflexota bacterium]|nr:hypothetical protein [Chloroflexota bacterium]